MIDIAVTCENWPLARPFAISRGTRTCAEPVVVSIREDGREGRGECLPYARYGETASAVADTIRALAPAIAAGMNRDALQRALPPGAARNALDCALWDLEAKKTDRPVWELAGLGEPDQVVTAFTLGLDSPKAMAQAARDVSHLPLLKMKLAGEGDLDRVAAVRRASPGARIIVDANEGWTVDMLDPFSAALADLGVEAIEQPLPAGADQALAGRRRPVPVYADESCHDRKSLPDILGKYDGINIKLDKTGGLTEALALKREATASGLKIMVGCMVSTSLAMAPAMLLAQDAAIADLDGPLLLARDREHGLRYSAGKLSPPNIALWG